MQERIVDEIRRVYRRYGWTDVVHQQSRGFVRAERDGERECRDHVRRLVRLGHLPIERLGSLGRNRNDYAARSPSLAYVRLGRSSALP